MKTSPKIHRLSPPPLKPVRQPEYWDCGRDSGEEFQMEGKYSEMRKYKGLRGNKHLPERRRQRLGGRIPVHGCGRSHQAFGQGCYSWHSESRGREKRKWKEKGWKGINICLYCSTFNTVEFFTLSHCFRAITHSDSTEISLSQPTSFFGGLTFPYWLLAPNMLLMLPMLLWGPTTREVPVSTIAWQPPLQATTWPLIVTLKVIE